MAEPIPLAELELRILLLPPISRGEHLGAPVLHAQRLVELWKIEAGDDVSLEQAFRLLDAEAIAGAILRTAAARDAEIKTWTVENLAKLWDDGDDNVDLVKDRPPADSSYWPPPSLNDLLPELHAETWQAQLDGEQQIEAVRHERGKTGLAARPVPLVELPRLAPDWELSRLCRDGRDEWIDARVRRAPAEPSVEPPKRPPRAAPRAELLKGAMEEIAQGYPKDARPPPFEKIEVALKTRFPWITRQEARGALDYAPQLRGERGRPRKSSD